MTSHTSIRKSSSTFITLHSSLTFIHSSLVFSNSDSDTLAHNIHSIQLALFTQLLAYGKSGRKVLYVQITYSNPNITNLSILSAHNHLVAEKGQRVDLPRSKRVGERDLEKQFVIPKLLHSYSSLSPLSPQSLRALLLILLSDTVTKAKPKTPTLSFASPFLR